MPEHNQPQKEKNISERPNNFLRLIYTFLFLIIISVIIWRIFYYESPQEQLAKIEVANTIPDSENAATIYLQIFEDYNDSDLKPAFLTPAIEDILKSAPWASKDYPELSEWIQEHFKKIIEQISQASTNENCYFPILLPEDYDIRIQNFAFIRKLVFMLIISANNDISEERHDEALQKYICCIRTGRHFLRQPLAIDFLIGISIESLGTQKIRCQIMNENTTYKQIQTIEDILKNREFQLDEYWKEMLYVENLYGKIMPQTTSTRLLSQLKELWSLRKNEKATYNRIKEIYSRLITDLQGTQILVALRQYNNKNGKWPERLDELKPLLSSEDILIDPQNKGSFVYKLNDDSFILYSTGLNGIDENGQMKAPADDWPIWPINDPQTQNTGTKVSDPNTE